CIASLPCPPHAHTLRSFPTRRSSDLGARSSVRKLAGIEFAGRDYPQTFVLADLDADGIDPVAVHEPARAGRRATVPPAVGRAGLDLAGPLGRGAARAPSSSRGVLGHLPRPPGAHRRREGAGTRRRAGYRWGVARSHPRRGSTTPPANPVNVSGHRTNPRI